MTYQVFVLGVVVVTANRKVAASKTFLKATWKADAQSSEGRKSNPTLALWSTLLPVSDTQGLSSDLAPPSCSGLSPLSSHLSNSTFNQLSTQNRSTGIMSPFTRDIFIVLEPQLNVPSPSEMTLQTWGAHQWQEALACSWEQGALWVCKLHWIQRQLQTWDKWPQMLWAFFWPFCTLAQLSSDVHTGLISSPLQARWGGRHCSCKWESQTLLLSDLSHQARPSVIEIMRGGVWFLWLSHMAAVTHWHLKDRSPSVTDLFHGPVWGYTFRTQDSHGC